MDRPWIPPAVPHLHANALAVDCHFVLKSVSSLATLREPSASALVAEVLPQVSEEQVLQLVADTQARVVEEPQAQDVAAQSGLADRLQAVRRSEDIAGGSSLWIL